MLFKLRGPFGEGEGRSRGDRGDPGKEGGKKLKEREERRWSIEWKRADGITWIGIALHWRVECWGYYQDKPRRLEDFQDGK